MSRDISGSALSGRHSRQMVGFKGERWVEVLQGNRQEVLDCFRRDTAEALGIHPDAIIDLVYSAGSFVVDFAVMSEDPAVQRKLRKSLPACPYDSVWDIYFRGQDESNQNRSMELRQASLGSTQRSSLRSSTSSSSRAVPPPNPLAEGVSSFNPSSRRSRTFSQDMRRPLEAGKATECKTPSGASMPSAGEQKEVLNGMSYNQLEGPQPSSSRAIGQPFDDTSRNSTSRGPGPRFTNFEKSLPSDDAFWSPIFSPEKSPKVDSVRGGSAREGSAREGSAREGSAREGSAREGSAREGSARDGSVRENSVREDFLRNEERSVSLPFAPTESPTSFSIGFEGERWESILAGGPEREAVVEACAMGDLQQCVGVSGILSIKVLFCAYDRAKRGLIVKLVCDHDSTLSELGVKKLLRQLHFTMLWNLYFDEPNRYREREFSTVAEQQTLLHRVGFVGDHWREALRDEWPNLCAAFTEDILDGITAVRISAVLIIGYDILGGGAVLNGELSYDATCPRDRLDSMLQRLPFNKVWDLYRRYVKRL